MYSNNYDISKVTTVLITGATAGIGRALALAISEMPHKPRVIGIGRREERLKELEANGIETVRLDVGKATKSDWEQILEKYPNLDAVFFNAGIQREIDVSNASDSDLQAMMDEINVNYTSVVVGIAHTLPHFKKRSEQGQQSIIAAVTSILGVIPGAWVANYSASKAALRSYTMSLRALLQETHIKIVEISPPLVESELHDVSGTTDKLSKHWMPLNDFIRETMAGLSSGDMVVTPGIVKDAYQKYESGKEQIVESNLKQHVAQLAQGGA